LFSFFLGSVETQKLLVGRGTCKPVDRSQEARLATHSWGSSSGSGNLAWPLQLPRSERVCCS
jgi:hypothetical protein